MEKTEFQKLLKESERQGQKRCATMNSMRLFLCKGLRRTTAALKSEHVTFPERRV